MKVEEKNDKISDKRIPKRGIAQEF